MLLLVLVALLVVVPLVELYVIIQVAQQIGGLSTIGLLILSSVIGGWLLRVEGFGVVRRFRSDVMAGRLPAAPLVDGLLILVGGLLMLVPGFVSDTLGLLLLLPPVRLLARKTVLRRAQVRVQGWGGGPRRRPEQAGSTDGVVIDVEGWEEPPVHDYPTLPRGPR